MEPVRPSPIREPARPGAEPPPPGSVARWAWDAVLATEREAKLAPPPPPEGGPGAWPPDLPARRLSGPGRPPGLVLLEKSEKTPRPGALVHPRARAWLLHAFLHHELQAAELLAWAVLAFPETPLEFRRGLVAIAGDEYRHLAGYRRELQRLGRDWGDFPVRDWFWQRVPRVPDPAAFTAVLGMGLEGGNLEHAPQFARRFRDAGDEATARLLERVGREEEAHVRFALTWFERFTGRRDFEAWRAHLPRPLSPSVLRGKPLARAARLRAGFDEPFLDRLEAWKPATSGS